MEESRINEFVDCVFDMQCLEFAESSIVMQDHPRNAGKCENIYNILVDPPGVVLCVHDSDIELVAPKLTPCVVVQVEQ